MNASDRIRQHYNSSSDEEQLGRDVVAIVDGLSPEAFAAASDAGFDQFHTWGMAATVRLAQLAHVEASTNVFDAGSGFGGPARYLARAFGCHVDGLDLTPAFVNVAKLMSDRLGLHDLVTFEIGDLAVLPYADAIYDLVWTQHVVMNVPDRDRVYAEFRRVLVPGGRVAFYDIVAADDDAQPKYPVPWAETEASSFLLTKTATIAAFERAGFTITAWDDVTDEVIAWFARGGPTAPTNGLSLASLMGSRFPEMAANLARNLREGRLRVAMGICSRRPITS